MGCASSTVEVAEGEVYAIKMSGAKQAERSEYEVSKYEEPNIEDTEKEEGTIDEGREKPAIKGGSGDKGIGPGFDPVVWYFWCCRFCSAWRSCDGEFLVE
ncbi:hypothetical protein FOZ62_000514 [Perkinsus olseni]|uniref:Uncharacterized protein n=1 Tax=Perkinsus olseni TaxID=32597 RepID=A0A7J6RU07_PEROL|nr:hypothetical protein FOZ62_000514 [Perkinsus olseni]